MAMGDKQYTLDAYVLDALMRDLVGHDHREIPRYEPLMPWRRRRPPGPESLA